MIYKAKANIQDGIVHCASNQCENCMLQDKCIDVSIIDKEENLGRKILIKKEEIKRGNYDE